MVPLQAVDDVLFGADGGHRIAELPEPHRVESRNEGVVERRGDRGPWVPGARVGSIRRVVLVAVAGKEDVVRLIRPREKQIGRVDPERSREGAGPFPRADGPVVVAGDESKAPVRGERFQALEEGGERVLKGRELAVDIGKLGRGGDEQTDTLEECPEAVWRRGHARQIEDVAREEEGRTLLECLRGDLDEDRLLESREQKWLDRRLEVEIAQGVEGGFGREHRADSSRLGKPTVWSLTNIATITTDRRDHR